MMIRFRDVHGKLKNKIYAMNKKVLLHSVLLLVSAIMLLPFFWMILTAFKTQTEVTQVNPFIFFPKKFQTEAFINVLHNYNWLSLYINTLLFMFWRCLCAVITASMAGYAFGRLKFRGKNIAFSLVLLQMMVPSQIFVIPQYAMISKLGLNNTMFSLVFPGLVTAFGTFLLRQVYRNLPKELEEAAILDGCNIGQRFLFVMAPLTKPSLIALTIFTALFAYKDLMWPMIVASRKDILTLAPALAKMQGQFATKYPDLMAAALFASVPMIAVYVLFQRKFMASIARTGGK